MALSRKHLHWVAGTLAIAAMISFLPADATNKKPSSQQKPHSVTQNDDPLDQYLSSLERGGAMDKAFYLKLPDGRYQLIEGRDSNRNPKYFTREELLRKFGIER